jgi:hypothetical protein
MHREDAPYDDRRDTGSGPSARAPRGMASGRDSPESTHAYFFITALGSVRVTVPSTFRAPSVTVTTAFSFP